MNSGDYTKDYQRGVDDCASDECKEGQSQAYYEGYEYEASRIQRLSDLDNMFEVSE